MSNQEQGSNQRFAKPPVLNPAAEQPDGPNTTHQGDPKHGPKETKTSDTPIATNPSKLKTDPLQVLVQPVDKHEATLNQDFPQNRVDKDGKPYSNAQGPIPGADS